MDSSSIPPILDETDCSWTVGDDPNLVHYRRIDVGASGEVHEVCVISVTRANTSSASKKKRSSYSPKTQVNPFRNLQEKLSGISAGSTPNCLRMNVELRLSFGNQEHTETSSAYGVTGSFSIRTITSIWSYATST